MKWKVWLRDYWPLLLPPLLILPGVGSFPYHLPESLFSDIPMTFYPNLLLLKRCLFEQHTVPLWSPLILSGSPFVANPQSGIMYPFGWPALLLPLPLGINLMVMLHLLWGGAGMAAFLRKQGRTPQAALLGGLAFSAMPKLFAHYGAGHLAFLYAIPWIPWLLLAAALKSRKWYSQPGLLLAVISLASPMWAAFSGLLWLSWEAANWWASVRENRTANQGTLLPVVSREVKSVLFQTGLALLLSSPLLLPLVQYIRLSTRTQMSGKEMLVCSLDPANFMGLLFPDFGGFHELVVYPGVVVMCLAAAAILLALRKREVQYWLMLVLFCYFYALGQNAPGVPWLMSLPGLSFFRVPTRILFIAGFGLAVLAAYGYDQLVSASEKRYFMRLTLAGLLGFCLIVGMVVWYINGQAPLYIFWGAGGIVLFWLWYEGRKTNQLYAELLILLVLVDLMGVDRTLFSMHPAEQSLEEGSQVAQVLRNESGRFRVYSPSYSIPQQTAAWYGLELADGVDPLQLNSYAEYMEKASGVPSEGYIDTQPPFASGNPAVDNRDYLPDIRLLGELGVRFVVSAFPLDIETEQVQQVGDTWIYTIQAAPMPEMLSINERLLQVQGGGVVKIPEVYYPGWRVYVDGEPAELLVVDGLFQGVEVPAGDHEIRLVFQPQVLYWGLGLWVVGVAALVWQQRKQGHDI